MNRGIKNAPRSPASREIKPPDHLCHVIVTIPFVESVSIAWIRYGRAYNQVSSHCGFLPCSSVMLPSIGVRFERPNQRSEEHTSELQSLMRISYAVFCLKKKIINKYSTNK